MNGIDPGVARLVADHSRRTAAGIALLPRPLAEAVARAYLSMRAIDEIEDHPTMANAEKSQLLEHIGEHIPHGPDAVDRILGDVPSLPPVSARLGEWMRLPPQEVAPRIDDAVSAMAARMARWARRAWRMESGADLDAYCRDVSGAMFVLLDDLWSWRGVRVGDRRPGMRCGMAIQLAHIANGRREDLERGVDFLPAGWEMTDLLGVAQQRWSGVAGYLAHLPEGPVRDAVAAVVSQTKPATQPR